jgi:uncharacterized protein (TIGR03089 family)
MARPDPVIADVLASLQHDRSRPRFTSHTPAGRTELSGAALLNWGAKAAGLLVDELGADAADEVLVRTPAHWQTAGILIGTWWAGLTITDRDAPGIAAAFVPPFGDAVADEVFVVSGHPLGLAARDLAGHQRDYTTSVLGQADRFTPRFDPDPASAIRSGDRALSVAALRSAIRAPSGITTNQRVLTAGTWSLDGGVPAVVTLLLRPLAVGASVIHCIDLDPAGDAEAWAHRAKVERADFTMGVEVAGLPRLA